MQRREFLKSAALTAGSFAVIPDGSAGQVSPVYIRAARNAVRIGNSFVELGFDIGAKGSLTSLVDKSNGYEFNRDPKMPRALFRIALKRPDRRVMEWFDSRNARSFTWSNRESPTGNTLVLQAGDFPNEALQVRIEITLKADSPLSSWRMFVTGTGDRAVYQLVCPIVSGLLKAGDTAGDAIAIPRLGEGYVFKNPYPVVDRLPLKAGIAPDAPRVGMGEVHQKFPGAQSMQMMLYYNDRAGLYIACHDSRQNVKTFDIGQVADWGEFPIFSISHFPGGRAAPDTAVDYDTILGVFHGDWYDGADIYKAWATQQWWCRKKLWDRDIPEWMRNGFGVFQSSNYHIPEVKLNHSLAQIAETVNGLSKDAGVPLLALVFNFEGGGGWTGPAGFFPPREGEEPFREAMRQLRAAGNFGFVYMPGGNWYIEISAYSPPFNSWPQFEKQGRLAAIKDESGEVPIARYYAGWQSTRLCPHAEFTKMITADLILGSLQRGCTVVQIDNFPISNVEACYDPKHGHPAGYGPWWSEDWNAILADTRKRAKALDPECALTTEGVSENFIPHIDMYDQRAGNMEYFGHWRVGDPMGGETIPIFGYVYGEYIAAYFAALNESNRPEVLYWTRALGKCLAQGVVPTAGHYFPEPKELNPVTIGFFKKVVAMAGRDCWKYMMFGRMLRAPKVDGPSITASYMKFTPDADRIDVNNRHEVRDSAIQCSAWMARDGSLGFIFANVAEKSVEFEAELDGVEADHRYDIDRIVDGKRSTWLKQTTLPLSHKFRLDALSVMLVEAKPRR